MYNILSQVLKHYTSLLIKKGKDTFVLNLYMSTQF